MKIHRFWIGAGERISRTGERYGQALFNHLESVRPDLANRVRGTDADPFRCFDAYSAQIERFAEFVEREWSRKPAKRRGFQQGKTYWGYSVDGPDGQYFGAFGSRDAAISEARCERISGTFWVCSGTPIVVGVDDSDVIERLHDYAHDEAGPHAEEPIIVHGDDGELQRFLDDWCARHVEINAWKANAEPEEITG